MRGIDGGTIFAIGKDPVAVRISSRSAIAVALTSRGTGMNGVMVLEEHAIAHKLIKVRCIFLADLVGSPLPSHTTTTIWSGLSAADVAMAADNTITRMTESRRMWRNCSVDFQGCNGKAFRDRVAPHDGLGDRGSWVCRVARGWRAAGARA